MIASLKIIGLFAVIILLETCQKANVTKSHYVGTWKWIQYGCSMDITINADNTGEMKNSNPYGDCFNKYPDCAGTVFVKNYKLHVVNYTFSILNKPQKTGKIIDSLPEWEMTLESSLLWGSQKIDLYKYSLN